MASRGIAADAVDRLELWQIAAALGVGDTKSSGTGAESKDENPIIASFLSAAAGEIPEGAVNGRIGTNFRT